MRASPCSGPSTANDPDKWERYRPIIATAFLQQTAFHQVGLSPRLDLGAAVRTLAKKHRVRVQEVKIAGVGDVLDALKTMQPATENTCVEASLVTIENGLPRLIDRARAWATGNVERIENLPEPAEVDACLAALDSGAAAGDLHPGSNPPNMARVAGKVSARRRSDVGRGQHGPAARTRRPAR